MKNKPIAKICYASDGDRPQTYGFEKDTIIIVHRVIEFIETRYQSYHKKYHYADHSKYAHFYEIDDGYPELYHRYEVGLFSDEIRYTKNY